MSDYTNLSTDDIRQGEETNWMPMVLGISTVLSVIAIFLTLIGFAQA